VARTGLDIVRIRKGLERVSLYAMGQPTITPDDVKQAVAAGPEAHADFGIANAIQRNDVREALREVGRSLDAGMVPFFILGSYGSPRIGCRHDGSSRPSKRSSGRI
jgi:DNA polymerase III delta subunit